MTAADVPLHSFYGSLFSLKHSPFQEPLPEFVSILHSALPNSEKDVVAVIIVLDDCLGSRTDCFQ